jgi:predicted phage-related endonuclease
MSDRQVWLEARKKGIGGTDWEDILNLRPYGCARRCWYEKRGVEPDYFVDEDKGVLRRGKLLEPFVISEFERKTGRRCYEPACDENGMLLGRASDLPDWWLGTPDAFIHDEGEGSDGVLECKTSSPWVYADVLRNGVPQRTLAQRMHYMALARADWGVVAYLDVSAWAVLPLPFETDQEMIDLMLDVGEKFWQDVQNNVAPERLDAVDTRCKDCPFYPTCQGELVWAGHEDAKLSKGYDRVDDPALEALVKKRIEIKRIMKDSESMLDEIHAEMVEKIGRGKGVEFPGVGKVRISDGVYKRTDYKAMAKAHPKIFSEKNLKKFKVAKAGNPSVNIYPAKRKETT